MIEIINKLDGIIRDMDYHNWAYDSEVYGGITYGEIIEITLALIRMNGDNTDDYCVGYISMQ